MADPTTEPTTIPDGQIARDPSLAIRRWVALFLRIGIGLSLLSTGLAGYFGQQGRPFGGGGGGPWGQGLPFPGLDPFFSALPYLAIGLGLALILGFLTTASAVASAFFSLLMPIFSIVQIVGSGASGGMNMGNRWGNDPFSAMMMSMLLPSLIPQAALIWFSPLENHPYSIDALIFGRNEIETLPRVATPARSNPFDPEPPNPDGPNIQALQDVDFSSEPDPVVRIGE